MGAAYVDSIFGPENAGGADLLHVRCPSAAVWYAHLRQVNRGKQKVIYAVAVLAAPVPAIQQANF